MAGIGLINLKVVIMDTDYYAMHAINSYLAWDRRTRVTYMANNLQSFWDYMRDTAIAELPDVIIMDADHIGSNAEVKSTLSDIGRIVPNAMIICVSQTNELHLLEAVADGGARAFLLKHEVGMQIAWAIVYSMERDFVITHDVGRMITETRNRRVYAADILPEQRDYPEMTDRIRQAIRLCVIEGMPAHLAADEMGISLHTIRGYIKEGYRILESYDQHEYPTDMTPQERAFMRFTALSTQERSQ